MYLRPKTHNRIALRPLLYLTIAAVVLYLSVFALAAVLPERSGDILLENRKLRVDEGHSENGYIYASSLPSQKKLKLRIEHNGDILTYDLGSEGGWESFPLQQGSGTYTVTLYEQISGKKYAAAGRVKVDAALLDEQGAFLYPNQYVSYTGDSKVVRLAGEVCAGRKTETEKFAAVKRYILDNLSFDYMKLVGIAPGTLPDIDGCLEKGAGICQDLAAVAVAMLRSEGIHARLVIGYADENYHSWVTATVDGREAFFDPTADMKAIKNVKQYTAERIY